MSTTYTGVRAIASSTNAAPIVVTTSSAHGLTNGTVVVISGHLVNTAANGSWVVASATSTTFALTGSTGNGVGAATGNVFVVPSSITIPSDGDARNALSVNAALDGLMDGLLYALNTQGLLRCVAATANGTFQVPPNVNFLVCAGFGGGGGGGGGAGGSSAVANQYALGGGGGGAALMGCQVCTVTPGTTLSYTIGSGGGSGAAGAVPAGNGGVGGDGTDTTISGLVTFKGASGGMGGVSSNNQIAQMVYGGSPVAPSASVAYAGNTTGGGLGNIGIIFPANMGVQKVPAAGGFGCTNDSTILTQSACGMPNPTGLTGGPIGNAGADNGTNRGGGRGGGGGGSATPVGGGVATNGGGSGGSAAAVTGLAGSGGGTTAVANSGSGGGGGGGGGAGGTTGAVGGAGGVGTAGRLWIFYVAGPNQ